VWRQLLPEGVTIAKCTVEPLMKAMGLAGVRRGKSCVTTVPDRKALCSLNKVNREFRVHRPNALWGRGFQLGLPEQALRPQLGRLRLCGVRHRRVRPPDRRLEGQQQRDRGFRAGCTGAGHPCPASHGEGRARASLGQGLAIPRHELHPAPGGGKAGALGRQRRRFLRQCPGRDHQRPVQRPRSSGVSAPGPASLPSKWRRCGEGTGATIIASSVPSDT